MGSISRRLAYYKMTPTQLSLKLLKKEGYTAQVVESWVPVAHVRRDLFGIIDILAIKPGVFGVLGIQCTSFSNMGARLKKAGVNKHLLTWYKTGNNFEVWGSHKVDGKWVIEKKELVEKKFLPDTSSQLSSSLKILQ